MSETYTAEQMREKSKAMQFVLDTDFPPGVADIEQVVAMLRQGADAVETLAAVSALVREKYAQVSKQYAANTTDDYEEGRRDALGGIVAALDGRGVK